jgi:hypothetical protein
MATLEQYGWELDDAERRHAAVPRRGLTQTPNPTLQQSRPHEPIPG